MSRNNTIYGDKHTFTSYSDNEVILRGSAGQQLTIQGSLNIIDKGSDVAGLYFNGAPLNVSTTSALYLDNLSDVQVSSIGYLQHLVATAGGNWVNSNYTSGLKVLATTNYDFGIADQDYVWNCMQLPATFKNGGTEPSFTEITGSNGFYGYEFPYNQTKNLYFVVNVPYDWKYGTDFYMNVNFVNAVSTNTNSGCVKWNFTSSILHVNQASGAQYNFNSFSPTTINIGVAEGFRAYSTESDNYFSGDIRVEDIILLKLTRDTAVGNNYVEPVWVNSVDIHYQCNKFGTKSREYPFYT